MAIFHNIVDEYKRTHQESLKLHERATKCFAANGATHIARIIDPFRPYITHAKGSRKWDVDGNEYIDYIMCHGALLLGHCHPIVVQAVQEQMTKGVHYGENHELEVEWAELIKDMMPSAERVQFFSCGNEANMMALRLGRVFTGRKKTLRFEHHFHGWADQFTAPGTPGVIPDDSIVIIPANDLSKVEEELAKKEYAVLMTEASGAFMGGKVPLDVDFVRALPELTRKYGTVWVLDEVVTGFRDSPGGWQAVVGVKPDLTVLGKCVGGGLGAGAIVGRADIMDAFNPKVPLERHIPHSGTWNANPLTAAAGIAACKLYKTGEPQRKAAETSARLRQDGNKALKERGISGSFYGRSMVYLYLGPVDYEPPEDILPPTKDISKLINPKLVPIQNQLLLHLLQRGISNMRGILFVVSAAHTKEDIDQTVEAFGKSLDIMKAEGLL
jgi:glutamate-1-semialdehyde 2,1-aminomutase